MLVASYRLPTFLKTGAYLPANILCHDIWKTIKKGDEAKDPDDGTFLKVVTITSPMFQV